jgi:hypothetical protein
MKKYIYTSLLFLLTTVAFAQSEIPPLLSNLSYNTEGSFFRIAKLHADLTPH